MIRPFRLRYVNQLVGSFVLLIVLLMVSGALLIAQRKDLFEARYNVLAFLAETELGGIAVGTNVYVLGQRAGQIRDIRYVTNSDVEKYEKYTSPRGELENNVIIRIELNESVKSEVFVDSVGHVKRKLAGAGETYIDVVRGRRAQQPLEEGGVLRLVPSKEAGQELQEMVERLDKVKNAFEDVRDAMVPAFEKFEKAAENVDRTAGDIGTMSRDLSETSHDFSETSREFRSVAEDFQEVTPRLGPLVDETQRTVNIAEDVFKSVREETDQLPGTVNQVHDTLDGAQDVIDGLRRHWLLRRYVDQDKRHKLISPSEVGRGGSWP